MKNKIKNCIVFFCFAMALSLFCLAKPSFALVPIGGECSTADQCDDGLFCNGEEGCGRDDSRGGIKVCYRSLGPFHVVPSFRGSTHIGGESICEPDSNPYTRDYCDEDQDRCVHESEDTDGDGHATYRTGGDDCNDHDAQSYPGNTEVCDDHGHDEDCDPTTVGREDLDHDGYNSSKCYNIQADGSRKYDTERH